MVIFRSEMQQYEGDVKKAAHKINATNIKTKPAERN